jgi:two-component system chemotaxis sensor kinase CheA
MDPDLDDLMRTFVVESEENLRALDEGFVTLESNPDDAEVLASIFRMAHTLKGNAASLGFGALAELAHAVEEVLDRLRERALVATPPLVNALLEAVDALRELLIDATQGREGMRPSHAAILQRLASEAAAPGSEPRPQASIAPLKATSSGAPSSSRTRSLRVDIDRLNRLLNLTGEIAIERGRVREMMERIGGRAGERLLERHQEADALHAELHELVMKLRMVPIGPTFRQYIRTVRDASASVGKMARLVIEGEEVEMDTALVESVRDPLTHMIRNAIDHGIEPPDVRRSRGKDPAGLVTLRARHDGGGIVIQVSDDGGGLRRDAIVERATALGVAGAAEMKDKELFALVFRAGFSTAKGVTDLSGRGVGMDVVERNVRALRGTIAIDSREGQGTTFTIRLPLTVAIIDGFAVTAGSETYVVPLDTVTECLALPPQPRRAASGVVQLRGAAIPYFRLRDLFQVERQGHVRGPVAAEVESLVLVRHEDEHVGLAVDGLLGVSQVVIKSAGKLLDGQPGLAGSTILGTGKVAFILDVPQLLRMAMQSSSLGGAERSRAL